MLQRGISQWQLYPHRVKYSQHDETVEQYALPNKKWWIDFADKWEHAQIIEFTEVKLNEAQLTRFDEIKDMPEDFMYVYVEYVLTGSTSDGFDLPTKHPFNIIRLRKVNEFLKAKADANTETTQFHEDLIVEMAMKLY